MRVRPARFHLERPGLLSRQQRRKEWRRMKRSNPSMTWDEFNRYWDEKTGTKAEAKPETMLTWG